MSKAEHQAETVGNVSGACTLTEAETIPFLLLLEPSLAAESCTPMHRGWHPQYTCCTCFRTYILTSHSPTKDFRLAFLITTSVPNVAMQRMPILGLTITLGAPANN
jgi:hypothetical protein